MRRCILVLMGLLFFGCDSQYTQETRLDKIRTDAFQVFHGIPYNTDNEFNKKINDLADSIIKENNINEALREKFINCLHYNIWVKSPDIALDIPIKSCIGDYNNNILQDTTYFNPSYVMGNFSIMDGSNAIVERYIKSIMNDEGSYKHIKTTYAIRGSENPQNVSITTNFSGANAFGGIVKQTIKIKLDSRGKIIEVD